MKKIGKKALSMLLVALMVVSVMPLTRIEAEAADYRVENAVTWAINIANNNKYGYSDGSEACGYKSRLGPDYDCSSLISSAYNKAGFNVYAGSNTRTMKKNFTAVGFKWIPASQLGGTAIKASYLKRGDILLSETYGHTELYIGNNQRCGAHWDYDKKTGDGDGKEINVQTYCNYFYRNNKKVYYEGVLRYEGNTQPPLPSTPAINSIFSNVAVNSPITISWGAASNAVGYKVYVSGAETKDIDVKATSTSIVLNKEGTYYFSVAAYNSAGKYGSKSSTINCTAHPKCIVTIKDYNGKEIEKKYVDYGGDISIQAPSREGYTFQGWDGSTHGITKDVTLTPIYKINTYNVKFWGNNDQQLGETQKVNYGEDATPPADTGAPENYEFVNWSSEDYKNVFTNANDKTINIYAIYKWANEDIPITCEITEAYRDSNGYHVMYNLKNNISSTRNGRAIITLKTAEGKLVYTTESKAFSMPGNSEKNNIDEFFECDETASVIEIIIVNSYTSGIPISKSVTKKVTDGLGWSNWQDGTAPAGIEAEERTVYRYRDKQTTIANTKTLSGWTYTGERKEIKLSETGFQDATVSTYDNETGKCVKIGTQTVDVYGNRTKYRYYHYYNPSGGSGKAHYWCPTHHGNESYSNESGKWTYHIFDRWDTPATSWGYSSCNSSKQKFYGPACSCGTDKYWFLNNGYPKTEWTVVGSKTQYNYATYKYEYSFWRWMDWSEWSTTAVTATTSRGVETKTQYRTYNGVEDTSGTVLTKKYYAGTDFAGKQATLFVYKFDAASDYTDEFVGQAVVGNDGYCTFNIKLREQPSIKTGDFTVALGIEGTTNTFVVDTFEAPKPTYTVNFYDWDGTIIETQTVTEGESATLPSYLPEKEGYDFIGWSDTLTNVREDRDIFADMEKKEYQVIFVDWANQLIEVKTFTHGDVLVTPEFTQVKGYTFTGWDAINEGKVLVTSNMVVNAQYQANVYTVKFCDYDGNVIDVQEVEYGKTATPPEDVESADAKQFAGWYDPETYEFVEHDISVFPAYYYEETANVPTANYESGEFNQSLKLTLITDDENEVIFYYLNGDETTEQIYTGPIDITKSTAVTYYASCINKNDSEEVTQYYCINTSDQFSSWMLYDNLPEDVRVNTKDYNLENADGYRYKNIVTTSSVADAADYVADGWEYLSEAYSAYSAWQDAEIKVDNSLIGFEVATQQVADNTVTRYQYSHYKYTDSNGVVCYSPTSVSGYTCEYETVVVDNRLGISGFLDDANGTAYYSYNGAQWFTQTKVPGEKTQYRSRYKINSYYKWSDWGINGPTALETREYETSTVYRYSNKVYHIVTVITEFDSKLPSVQMYEHISIVDLSWLEIDGYNLEGIYTDSEHTKVFTANTPITESITLYAKHTPKTYTVRFQMQDGTELDTQTVSYMESAVAPETDAVPGYVFSKWDKDFSCITEDTVVTGRYYKESDYARITLDRTVLDMFQGNDVKLNYTISPANLSGEAVEWSSSDPNIATVDDKGVVTALLPGEVTITAMVIKTRETATCRVIVNEDCGNYIVLTANSTLNNDSLGYLRRISFNTTVESAALNFRNDNLEFYNIEGIKLTNSSVVGTGTTIVLKNGDSILDKETVVITGDMTGDGLLNNRDVAMVNRYLVNKVTPQECQVVALDLNGDGYINNKDAAMAARYLVGKDAII